MKPLSRYKIINICKLASIFHGPFFTANRKSAPFFIPRFAKSIFQSKLVSAGLYLKFVRTLCQSGCTGCDFLSNAGAVIYRYKPNYYFLSKTRTYGNSHLHQLKLPSSSLPCRLRRYWCELLINAGPLEQIHFTFSHQ